MKILKRIIIAAIPLIFLAGCSKNITDLNVDTKNPTSLPYASMFTYGQYQLSNLINTADYDYNPMNFFVQYLQETTYLNESQYDIGYRSIPDVDWNILYVRVLSNLRQSDSLAKLQITDSKQLANVRAQIDIMEVTAFYYLLTTYGNIPYSGAFDPTNNAFPKYDDALTVYKDLLSRLTNDIAALDDAADGIGAADQIYSGNIDSWKKFANSLALRMGIVIADADDALAKATIEAAAPNVFTSIADDATYNYTINLPYVNPTYNFAIVGGRSIDFVACQTFINQLQSNNDPRLPLYFTTDPTGGYSGGNPGAATSYTTHSKMASIMLTPSFRGVFMDYAETQFYLAEAAERGYNVGGSAAQFYQNGVKASIVDWGGTQANADTYYAQPSVTYATAAGSWQQKIGTQAWVALYNRAWDSWTEYRRLAYPNTFTVPFRAVSGFPQRFLYPTTEKQINQVNYAQAAAAIGGDEVTTRLFFQP